VNNRSLGVARSTGSPFAAADVLRDGGGNRFPLAATTAQGTRPSTTELPSSPPLVCEMEEEAGSCSLPLLFFETREDAGLGSGDDDWRRAVRMAWWNQHVAAKIESSASTCRRPRITSLSLAEQPAESTRCRHLNRRFAALDSDPFSGRCHKISQPDSRSLLPRHFPHVLDDLFSARFASSCSASLARGSLPGWHHGGNSWSESDGLGVGAWWRRRPWRGSDLKTSEY
jgi:hypothetical protein